MMKSAALVFLLLATVPAAAADDAAAAANAFYSVTLGLARAGGSIPDATARVRLAPLLTPRLDKALSDAAAAEVRFKAKNRDAPPLIEGDIFSSLFEGPTAFKVGICRGDDKTARCAIALTHQDPGQKPANWIDTLVLVNQGGWKVDDIAYDANFAFGNTGTLGDMLKMAMHEAP
jgi:hypothetical protein